MRSLLLIGFAAFSFAPAALAAEASGATARTVEPAEQDGDRMICRRTVPTGSVMARRECRSKAEWDAITARSQSDVRRTADQDRSRSIVGGNR
jgi:hypothetical protein